MSALFPSHLRVVVLASTLLASCSVYSPRTELAPTIELPESFLDSGVEAPDPWWRDFDDPDLTRLIEATLDDNLSLRMAWSRLDQARAVARAADAGRYPNVDLAMSGERQELADDPPAPRWKIHWSLNAACSRPTAFSPPSSSSPRPASSGRGSSTSTA